MFLRCCASHLVSYPLSEYKLWTDASSREFIAENYPWFLDTFDAYTYAIQRADAIRYFVLHYYGGVYIDLDIGCLKPMDPLLVYPVILPKTIPVGVSNDLMFAEKGHPLLEQTIHNLVTFDHNWILNYPTVMFSTGPMFLSAQYGIYTSSHPITMGGQVRILPRSLYGKNAQEGEAPHSFFSHFYGSSWHADDAAFIGFLGTWGKGLMWVGLVILVIGLIRMPTKQRRYSLRGISGYEVLFPRLSQRSGRWQLQFRGTSLSTTGTSTQLPSPASSDPNSPIDSDLPIIHFDVHPSSPTSSDTSTLPDSFAGRADSPIYETFRRVRNRVAAIAGIAEEPPRTPTRIRRQRHSRGVLFFLPAIFSPSQDIELGEASSIPRRPSPPPLLSHAITRASQLPPEKQRFTDAVGERHHEGSARPELSRSSSSSHNQRSDDTSLVDVDLPSQGSMSRSRSSSHHRTS